MTSFIQPIISTARRSQSQQTFGKVAVLMGGRSSEREISLQSGQNVLDALIRQGIDAHPVDPDDHFFDIMRDGKFDRAFIVLHGKEGEDGVIQGFLEMLKIPYTGSKVAASALSMDKARAKLVMNSLGIATPTFGLARTIEQAQTLAKDIGFPVSVKPVAEGSSIGVTRVASLEGLPNAFAKAKLYGDVIIEKWIDGKDFFVSILDEQVLPSVEVRVPGQFYDFEAKYESNQTQYLCPPPHSQEKEAEIRDLAYRAYSALGCEGWGRADLVQDVKGQFWVLEVNTIPGMTSHSLVPMSAKAAGIDFDELVLHILTMTLPVVSKDEKLSKLSQT